MTIQLLTAAALAHLLEGVGDRGFAERDVRVLAEPLLPLTRDRIARQAPALEELGRGRGPRHRLDEYGPIARLGQEERDRAVTAFALVAASR